MTDWQNWLEDALHSLRSGYWEVKEEDARYLADLVECEINRCRKESKDTQ